VALAQLYQRHQMFDRAEAEYRASLALDETDQPWFGLGSLYMQQNRLPEAEQAYSRAAQISSSPCLAYVGLAQVELSLRHAEPALRALDGAEKSSPYRNAEAIAPEFYGEIADDRAEAHRMLAQLPQAIRFEQEAVRLNPTVASLWNKLADLYASAGEPDLSNQARERARELGGGAGR
jgi:tetratricopeptide (TPR) repeat protein